MAGQRLERILDALLDEESFCTPLMRVFLKEAQTLKPMETAEAPWEHDLETASACLAYPAPIRYEGDRGREIRNQSMRSWDRFPESFKADLSDLLGRASPAAARFRALRLDLGLSLSEMDDKETRASRDSSNRNDKRQKFRMNVRDVLEKAEQADMTQVWQSLIHYGEGLDRLLSDCHDWQHNPQLMEMPCIAGDAWFPEGIIYAAQTPFGMVLVGGVGDNIYPAGDAFLIMDLGGDDTYFFDEAFLSPEDKGKRTFCSTVVDLSGNDHYSGEDGCVAAGMLGYRTILDFEGDDRYSASELGLGAGIMGAGILVDCSGNDLYTSKAFSLGAGAYGLGLLMDGHGDDEYRASFMSQGFAGPSGLGCLVDDSGEDLYICIPAKLADLTLTFRRVSNDRPEPMPTFSQGCSASLTHSGRAGLGMLIDLNGDDCYRAGDSSQGMASGHGIGLLLDGRGYDFYNGQDQCQGFGEEGGIGIHRDLMGNDHYIAHNNAQGVGAGNSLGMLIDDSGNDLYYAFENAQGRNRDNGTGILFDLKGDDQFLSKKETSKTE
ncbi:MAG: hypothetical protein ABIK28_01875 [Planctomycetota bacterium]